MQELDLNDPGLVLDALDVGLIVLDADGRVQSWNAWLAAASGITAERALGQTLEALFPDAMLRRLNTSIADALHAGASGLLTHALQPAMLPLKTRTGRMLIHNVSVRPIGRPPYTACLIQITDVTVAVERERVLRARQNARYDAVVDSALDAILTLDATGVIQFANPAAAREFGYSGPELVGQPMGMLFEDRAAWDQAWDDVFQYGVLYRPIELIARRRDGTPSYLEGSAAQWQSESRVFVTAILRDVNERWVAEQALHRLNETLEHRVATALAERKVLADIVETTDAFIQVVDFDFRLLAINKAGAEEFERVFAVHPKTGDDILELMADFPEERATIKALWTRAFRGEEFTTVQPFGTPQGGQRYYELKFNALRDATGQQFAAFHFVHDVSDRIEDQAQLARIEEALRQSQKMEAIGQLTGGIAHDFNNLLTGIIGAMDIMKRRIAARRFQDIQPFMDAAATSANRAAALTHRLLAFARRQPLDPKAVNPNQLIEGMEDLLRRTLAERIRLTTRLGSDLWPALTDAHQLENAVLNLAINARDAMPDGGELTISTQNVEFDTPVAFGDEEMDAGDYVVISVKDTGVGMAPDIVAKVFEPFFTTKPLGQGTGLGLSMIYGFAKQSRGHVRIESEVGRGTEVLLYLPRYRGALAVDDLIPGRDIPQGHGEAVLLVEDDSSVRLLIGEVLRDLGYACIEASDGQAALPILTSNTPLDLMITDVGLPGLNGRQLAEVARRHRPGLKVLFVTGYAEHATGPEGFLEPGMTMVTKPFALDALALKIRDIIGS